MGDPRVASKSSEFKGIRIRAPQTRNAQLAKSVSMKFAIPLSDVFRSCRSSKGRNLNLNLNVHSLGAAPSYIAERHNTFVAAPRHRGPNVGQSSTQRSRNTSSHASDGGPAILLSDMISTFTTNTKLRDRLPNSNLLAIDSKSIS
jgi:hypothetical protein